MRIISISFILTIFCASLFAYDIDAGRQTGMGGTVPIGSPSASDLLSVPSSLITERQILFESGFQRRYDLAELDRGYLAAGYRRGAFSIATGISQFGRDDYYSEKILRSSLGYYRGAFAFALQGSGKVIKIGNDYGSFNAVSLGMAGSFNYKEYHLAVVGDNLNKPTVAENVQADPTVWKIFAEVKGAKRFSVTGRIVMEKYQKISVTLGQYIFLTGRNAIFWGLSGNPLTYGGGVELSYSKFMLNYAAVYHPALGFRHNFSIGLGLKR